MSLLLRTTFLTACVLFIAPASADDRLPGQSKTSIAVFKLKHADAHEIETAVGALHGDLVKAGTLKVVANARTNLLLVQGTAETHKAVEQLLKVLDQASPRGNPQVDSKIFSLKNAVAAEAAGAVSALAGNDVKLVADERTNSVIATGPKDQLAVVEAILMRLDVPGQKRREMIRAVPLNYASVDSVMSALASLGTDAAIAADATRRQLLIKSDEATYAALVKVITSVDKAAYESSKRLQMRIVWLVDEKLAGKDAALPSKNLDGVVKVLKEKLGMGNLRLAAQMLVSINPSVSPSGRGSSRRQQQLSAPTNQFEASGTAQLTGPGITQVHATGKIIGRSGPNPLFEVAIRATGNVEFESKKAQQTSVEHNVQLASINTKIAVPEGHSVVLGVTPLRGRQSVFILQMLPELSAKSPASR